MIYRASRFGLPLFRIDTDIHGCGSIPRISNHHGYASHSEGGASTTADASDLHRRFVGVDGEVLESRPSSAPGNSRSLESIPHPVGFSSTPRPYFR